MTFIGSKIVQKKLRILNTLPYRAQCSIIYPNTQGVALGYVIVGLSARIN